MGRKKKEAITSTKTVAVATKSQVDALSTILVDVGERLTSLEDWHREVDYKTKHYDDMDTIMIDVAKALEELARWKDEVKDTWRHQPAPPQTEPLKNQDIARLEGLMTTYGQRVEHCEERTSRVERKYLLPDSYKPGTPDFAKGIITDSITVVENRLDSDSRRIEKLEDSAVKLRTQMDTTVKALAEMKTIKEKLGLDTN